MAHVIFHRKKEILWPFSKKLLSFLWPLLYNGDAGAEGFDAGIWAMKEDAGMSRTIYETDSAEATFALGKQLGEKAGAGDVYCLDGDLGTGKTVFTQGFAAGLGITEPVCSPTFTIVCEYEGGRLPFYHFDVYRIEEPEEMEEIGYEEYFYGAGAVMIEWASLVRELIPENAVWIRIEKDPEKGFDYRRITVEGKEWR